MFFSIVIPVFNKLHTIERCINSIIKQNHKDFEIIIIDDGSTDGGLDFIKNTFNDRRIRCFSQKNKGVSSARNVGVSRSKYEYISFLDADDEWLPEYLETISFAIEKQPEAGMICCAGIFKNENSSKTSLRGAKKYENQILKIDYFENPHVFTHTSATTVKKSEFLLCMGFPEKLKKNEDFALIFSVALNTTVVYCGFPYSVYYGNVKGQATEQLKGTEVGDLNTIERFNIVHQAWERSNKKNKTYLIFLKYEMRHIFLTAIKNNNYALIRLNLALLSPNILNEFLKFELVLIKNIDMKKIASLYLLFTKFVWRLHRYPRVNG
jgi:glycosyltransferase involved in cell wall biosynthesis